MEKSIGLYPYKPSVLFVGHRAASDQGLHCLLTERSNENDHPRTLRLEMDLWENTFGINGLKGLMVKRTYLNSPVCH